MTDVAEIKAMISNPEIKIVEKPVETLEVNKAVHLWVIRHRRTGMFAALRLRQNGRGPTPYWSRDMAEAQSFDKKEAQQASRWCRMNFPMTKPEDFQPIELVEQADGYRMIVNSELPA